MKGKANNKGFMGKVGSDLPACKWIPAYEQAHGSSRHFLKVSQDEQALVPSELSFNGRINGV